jgi:uncharacterized protein YfaS (alpha-2-macroglobulin family)
MKKLIVCLSVALLLPACAEVGSERWCENIKEKPKGDLTASEAKDYAKHCLMK